MRKVLDFVKANKKIIIVVVMIIILVGTVYFINKSAEGKAASTVSSFEGKSETEIKLMKILSSIEGVGETEVMINEGKDGIEGVVIVCKGADNIMTKNNILNAVSTALNVDKKNIAIYSMN